MHGMNTRSCRHATETVAAVCHFGRPLGEQQGVLRTRPPSSQELQQRIKQLEQEIDVLKRQNTPLEEDKNKMFYARLQHEENTTSIIRRVIYICQEAQRENQFLRQEIERLRQSEQEFLENVEDAMHNKC